MEMIEEVDVEMEKEKVLLMWRTMVRFGTKLTKFRNLSANPKYGMSYLPSMLILSPHQVRFPLF